MKKQIIDHTDKKFGYLIALYPDADRKKKNGRTDYRWVCLCLGCGDLTSVATGDFVRGTTKSCGCKQNGSQALKHGVFSSKGVSKRKWHMYHTWHGMRKRCDNPNDPAYYRYGGRGLGYPEEWKEFEVFYSDMKDGWRPGLELERKNNNLGYSKENCKWATILEQQNNRNNNVRFDFNGKNLTMAQWARELGIPVNAIKCRKKSGWSVVEILTTPLRVTKPRAPKVAA